MTSASLKKAASRVDAMNLRERGLLLVASVAVLFLLADLLGYQPIDNRRKVLLDKIEAQRFDIDRLSLRTRQMDWMASDESGGALFELRQDLQTFNTQLQSRLDGMLSPETAMDILEQVLVQVNGLRLNAVTSRIVPVVPDEGDEEISASAHTLVRHELNVHLEGSYLETLRYLRALETLGWEFFWTSVSLTVLDHPKASVDLEIHTLGQTGI